MANFEQFRQNFKVWSDKVNATVDSVVDQTATSLRIAARRHDLEKEYATLGKLTYQKLIPGALPSSEDGQRETDELTARIEQSMTRITAILAEIEELEGKSV
jgi:hypothetical protein